MRNIAVIVFLGCVLALSSCRRLNPFAPDDDLIAKVGSAELHATDVVSIFAPGMTPQDSIKLLESYVDVWIKKQLKIQTAESTLGESTADVERMVEDYRNSLLTLRLDQHYVDNNLDTLLADSQINDYYDSHRTDFILDRAIVKGVVVKLPYDHKQKAKVMELMPGSGDAYQDFLDMCTKNNFTVTEVCNWMDFTDFLGLLPTNRLRTYDDLLDGAGVKEMRDGDDLYLILITAHLEPGNFSPPDRVSDVIRRVIINQRKQEIVRHYEDSLYEHARANELFEIKIE